LAVLVLTLLVAVAVLVLAVPAAAAAAAAAARASAALDAANRRPYLGSVSTVTRESVVKRNALPKKSVTTNCWFIAVKVGGGGRLWGQHEVVEVKNGGHGTGIGPEALPCFETPPSNRKSGSWLRCFDRTDKKRNFYGKNMEFLREKNGTSTGKKWNFYGKKMEFLREKNGTSTGKNGISTLSARGSYRDAQNAVQTMRHGQPDHFSRADIVPRKESTEICSEAK